MSSLPVERRHPLLRWVAPIVVVGGVVAAITSAVSAKSAHSRPLPTTSAAQLVAAVLSSTASQYSGTIVAQLSLGLPDVARRAALADDPDDRSLDAALDGSHTMRVWSGGPNRQRLELVGATSEVDVVRDGQDVWEWNSDSRTATYTEPEPTQVSLPSLLLTPDELVPPRLAERLLTLLADSSSTVLRQGDQVADRPTYELVVTPRVSGSRIGSVHVEVDGHTRLPLGVQVYARGVASPAIDIAFSSVRFQAPASAIFTAPPSSGNSGVASAPSPSTRTVSTAGSGWLSVAIYHGGAAPADGKQRLATSDLLCILVTSSGVVLVGAVDPTVLYAASTP